MSIPTLVLALVPPKTVDMASTVEPAETRHEVPADDTRGLDMTAYFISLPLYDTLSRTTAMSKHIQRIEHSFNINGLVLGWSSEA